MSSGRSSIYSAAGEVMVAMFWLEVGVTSRLKKIFVTAMGKMHLEYQAPTVCVFVCVRVCVCACVCVCILHTLSRILHIAHSGVHHRLAYCIA